ncbi:unnamed protein product [Danaus chrysippus]|uniref:(African queen) hypothetical protein n=1 Tax=Danaus chrysippus TaxID=151541 RepID=A0A8J2WFU3_9NEOP|nr:unnamed protein product [Danaus chrysippus]
MVGDLRAVPLSALSCESRNLLSSRLNAKKILPVVGHDQISRHRDWRGLASLINISNEAAASIRCNDREDRTDKVLNIWINRNDGTATVGQLMDFLQILDRFDVCDDILELARDNKLIGNHNQIACNPAIVLDGVDDDFITNDDRLYGVPQRYHAYVLFAKEDREFVDELLRRMRQAGFKLCTEDDLIAGHATPFEPVSRLIAERCRNIVLVYSPDFLQSPAIAFYMNLAQADAISKKQLKIVPVMYRECNLPRHLAYYTNLRYAPHSRVPYDFWERLSQRLRIFDGPRITMPNSTSNTDIRITETSHSLSNGHQVNGVLKTLALPDVPKETSSLTNLHRISDEIPTSYDTKSLNGSRDSTDSKKKSGPFKKIMDTFRGKKHKKAISVEN